MKRVTLALGLLSLIVLGFALTTLITRQAEDRDQGVSVGGPFTLVDDDGKTVSDRDFSNKWLLVYFGYTHCPDACPTALTHIANAMDLLGPKAASIVPLFITVDPARDTPPVMRDYISAFDTHIHGLSGSADAINAVEAEYRVYAAKHPDPDGGYSMDHSSIIYLMDPKGALAATFTHETTVDAMVSKLRALGA